MSGTELKRTKASAERSQEPLDRFPSTSWMAELRSRFIRRVLYPTMQKRWHPLAYGYLEELRQFEFASVDTIERVQWTRLQALVRHAAQYVPYYRDLFRESGIQLDQITAPDF